MPKTGNTFYKVLIDENQHEVIPHRTTDGSYLGSIPTISTDKNLCVDSNGKILPSIPDTGEQFSLISSVKSNGTVEYVWILK